MAKGTSNSVENGSSSIDLGAKPKERLSMQSLRETKTNVGVELKHEEEMIQKLIEESSCSDSERYSGDVDDNSYKSTLHYKQVELAKMKQELRTQEKERMRLKDLKKKQNVSWIGYFTNWGDKAQDRNARKAKVEKIKKEKGVVKKKIQTLKTNIKLKEDEIKQ